jgi:hypothetical protein
MSKAIPKYKPADTGDGKALTLVHCNVIDVIQGGANHNLRFFLDMQGLYLRYFVSKKGTSYQ